MSHCAVPRVERCATRFLFQHSAHPFASWDNDRLTQSEGSELRHVAIHLVGCCFPFLGMMATLCSHRPPILFAGCDVEIGEIVPAKLGGQGYICPIFGMLPPGEKLQCIPMNVLCGCRTHTRLIHLRSGDKSTIHILQASRYRVEPNLYATKWRMYEHATENAQCRYK